jgi:hypothetical protein
MDIVGQIGIGAGVEIRGYGRLTNASQTIWTHKHLIGHLAE